MTLREGTELCDCIVLTLEDSPIVGYEIQTLLCAYVQGCADAQVCGYEQWDNRTMVSRTKGQWNNGTMGQRAIGCVGIASSCI